MIQPQLVLPALKKPVLRQRVPLAAAGVNRPPALSDEELPSLALPSADLAAFCQRVRRNQSSRLPAAVPLSVINSTATSGFFKAS